MLMIKIKLQKVTNFFLSRWDNFVPKRSYLDTSNWICQ